MNFEKEICAFWGERLIRYPKEDLLKFQLSQRDQSLLANVGLPNMGNDQFQFLPFVVDMYLYTCEEYIYLVIGSFGTHIFGIEVKTRQIYFIDKNCLTRDFLNSNLEFLLLFLIWTDHTKTDYTH